MTSVNGAPFTVPATSTLLAFEAVARLGSVSLAAKERRTSASAISRHIRRLEQSLGVELFARLGRSNVLTENGRAYFVAVQTSINGLRSVENRLRAIETRLTIGCPLDISVLILLPVYSGLKRRLGGHITLRVVTCDYDLFPQLSPSALDIVFESSPAGHPDQHAVTLLNEEVVPVASQAFLGCFGAVLAREPQHWSDVPRLEIARSGAAWATWDTWFQAHGCAAPKASVETFESYAHLLRASAHGHGIALGRNGFMSDYAATGQLVPIRDEWLRTQLSLYGVPTPSGARNHATKSCVRELARLVARLRVPSPAAHSMLRPAGAEAAASPQTHDVRAAISGDALVHCPTLWR